MRAKARKSRRGAIWSKRTYDQDSQNLKKLRGVTVLIVTAIKVPKSEKLRGVTVLIVTAIKVPKSEKIAWSTCPDRDCDQGSKI